MVAIRQNPKNKKSQPAEPVLHADNLVVGGENIRPPKTLLVVLMMLVMLLLDCFSRLGRL